MTKVTYESTVNTDKALYAVRGAVAKALEQALEPVREEAERLAPDSDQTGTIEQQSKRARRRHRNRPKVKDSIRVMVGITKDRTVIGSVYVDKRTAYVARFINNGMKHVLWGRDEGKRLPGLRFLEAAYETHRLRIENDIAAVTKRELGPTKDISR